MGVIDSYANKPEEAFEVLVANFNLMHKIWRQSLADWKKEVG